MIVRMSKIEIVGPKPLIQDVLGVIREMGIFQIDAEAVGFIEKDQEKNIRSFYPAKRTALEKLFLEEILLKIDELDSLLPGTRTRTSYIEPRSVLDAIDKAADRHIALAKDLRLRLEELQKEQADLSRHKLFLDSMSSILANASDAPDLDFIGLTIREPDMVERLRDAISRITDWKFELLTKKADDGTLVGLITVEKAVSEKLKRSLSEEQLPELSFPAAFAGLSFPEKIVGVGRRLELISGEIGRILSDLERLSAQWMPIYERVRQWVTDRLALITATASAFESRMCFFIHGWLPSKDLDRLRTSLDGAFGSTVVIEEKEIKEEDLDRVPIVLKNQAYFRPFELFTGLLPLPAYTSYDPTPFIGIFFPLFFGMILGDAGYGLVLGMLAAFLMRRFKKRKAVADAGRILAVSSFYTIFFGILFGEFFGDLPQRLFGLKPLCIERRTAIVPMLGFAVAVGGAHVFLGMVLGAVSAFRKRERKEALYRIISLIVIFCVMALVASLSGLLPSELARPVIIAVLFMTPLLFFTGGLLAPLELLKSIGNIISYVRIMAIGLTSVLLAFVANTLGGMTGDIVTGIVVGGLLHLLNILLGVFSPTIHSLRLHYVEFFSKFIVHGGKQFEPLKK